MRQTASIESGKVYVDGQRAVLGMKIRKGQKVQVGKKSNQAVKKKKVVLAVYKPVGIVCTEDPRTRNNIVRFLNYPVRITYAGRLDKDSEGLLLMTNDGDMINSIMRAANFHEKEYKGNGRSPDYRRIYQGKCPKESILQIKKKILTL